MNEPTILDRALMLLKTLANIVAWIAALIATLVRGKLRGSSGSS